MDDLFGEVVYAYTRAMAIADGVLVDVSELAQKAGFKFPTAFTSALWGHIKDLGDAEKVEERVKSVLDMAIMIAKYSSNGSDTIRFKVAFEGAKTLELKSICGPGDDAAPVLTFMFIHED